MSNDLIIITKNTDITKLFKPESIDDILAKIRAEVEGFVPDLSTAKGRKDIASLAAKVSKSKTLVDKAGMEYVRELKELPKKIDAERKRLRDECDKIRDEVRAPLTEWENVRKEIDDKIRRLSELPQTLAGMTSDQIAEEVAWINNHSPDDAPEDKREEYIAAIDNAKVQAEYALLKAQNSEAEAAELERLRLEEQERKAKEDEEARIRAAEQAAKEKAEREARGRELNAKLEKELAEKRAREAEERAARAEAEAKDRAERAAREAEERAKKQVEQERLRKEEAERERKEDERHRAKIKAEAESSLRIAGYSADEAERIVNLIDAGKVKNITVTY